jgi:hypothetical protein
VNLPDAGLSSFNGIYAISGTTNSPATITYIQSVQTTVTLTNTAGSNDTANFFDFTELDKRLGYAANPSPRPQVMYTFGKVPAFYSSNPTGDCGSASAPNGSCFRPADLNSNGTGLNQHWRLFVAGLAQHIKGLDSVHVQPTYFETWNEFDGDNFWHYNAAGDEMTNDEPLALVRLLDDAACIIKGTGTLTLHVGSVGNNVACTSEPNMPATGVGVLPTAKVLPPCVSSPVKTTQWANFYGAYTNSAVNADVIGIHSYGYPDLIQSISSISRDASGNVTVQVASATGYFKNSVALVSGVTDTSFDGAFTLTNVNVNVTPNQLQYVQTCTPSCTAATSSGGHIQNGPDQLKSALTTFRSGLTADSSKDLWVTEGWGAIPTSPSTADAAPYIVRWYTILASTGIVRANWYTWDLTSRSANLWDGTNNAGDIACNGTGTNPLCNAPAPTGYVNGVGQAYQVAEGWLTGATFPSQCSDTVANKPEIWSCPIQSAGHNELMVWDSSKDGTSGTSSYTPPSGSSYTAYIDLTGHKTTCGGNCTNIAIGARPILFVPN